MENKSYKKFRYVVINSQGKRVKGYLDVLREEEARAYLLSQEYEILTLKETSKFWTMNIGSNKLKYSELAFVLTQLSTYLKVSIPLIEAVKILEKQATKEEQKRVFANISYHLAKGESFSEALKSQKKVFPKLLINMIKASEQTGDLPKTLDDMALYYTDLDKTKKQTITAMTYPIIIFIFALMVITFILLYIIPEFVGLFEKNHAALPGITKFIINISNFLTNNIFIIVIVILLVILIYSYLYSKVKTFRQTLWIF